LGKQSEVVLVPSNSSINSKHAFSHYKAMIRERFFLFFFFNYTLPNRLPIVKSAKLRS